MTTTTTLSRIRQHGLCRDGWAKLLAHLGKTGPDDEPVPFAVIVESNGIADALWCCRAEPEQASVWRAFAARCARRALARVSSPDPRSVAAVDTAERHAAGLATDEELPQARRAAYAAAYADAAAAAAAYAAAYAAAAAAYDAAAAAYADAAAAYAAADAAAAAAAYAAADAAAAAAYDASAAAAAAAYAAYAADAEREAQKLDFLELVA